MKAAISVLLTLLALQQTPAAAARDTSATDDQVFERVEMLVPRGDKVDSVPVRLRLERDALVVESRKTGGVLKSFPYATIRSAEYSYSKHPRWKAGVGTAVGSLVFAPVLLLTLPVAIPLAFSKSKRHWLTVRDEHDYVVLRLDKNEQRLILPAFEVRSGVKVEALGESK